MNIVFVSNYMNVHQISFCEAMDKILREGGGGSFHFIAMTPFDEARHANGYRDMNDGYRWIVRAYESKAAQERAKSLCRRAELAIIAPEYTEFSDARVEVGGLTLLYSERILKRGKALRLFPPKRKRAIKRFHYLNRSNFGLLCAGSFVAEDMHVFDLDTSRCLKWGYFPAVAKKHFDGRRANDFLWVGRMVDWKQPYRALELMSPWLLQGATATFIGDGPIRQRFERTVNDCGLSSSVRIIPGLCNRGVREIMCTSKMFVTSSTRREGWGAVLNEAMASGCCCLASKHAGSTDFLIEDKVNGYTWIPGENFEMHKVIEELFRNDEHRAIVGQRAARTINEIWNAETAATRLVSLAELWLTNPRSLPVLYGDGPCSSSETISRAKRPNIFK